MKATKLDLTKEFRNYYRAKATPEVIELDEAPFLTLEGKGEPGGSEFARKIEALYPVAYSVKNLSKKQGQDFVVPKLEALWWVESGKLFSEVPQEEWRWKLLIRLPDFTTPQMVERAKDEVIRKKAINLANQAKFERVKEGRCVQIVHVGSYASETESITKMKDFMKANDLVERGFHHEIYLSDPTRTAENKLKTILRQPVKEVE